MEAWMGYRETGKETKKKRCQCQIKIRVWYSGGYWL